MEAQAWMATRTSDILYAAGWAQTVGGYYSSADEYSHLAHLYSNEKEMFYVNADNQNPATRYLLGVLAHEFQHMIHWYHDRNEETWMNEGSSVLAELLNGYDTAGLDYAFMSDPDLQLNTWSSEGAEANVRPTMARASCSWPTSSTALATRPPRRWWPTPLTAWKRWTTC